MYDACVQQTIGTHALNFERLLKLYDETIADAVSSPETKEVAYQKKQLVTSFKTFMEYQSKVEFTISGRRDQRLTPKRFRTVFQGENPFSEPKRRELAGLAEHESWGFFTGHAGRYRTARHDDRPHLS